MRILFLVAKLHTIEPFGIMSLAPYVIRQGHTVRLMEAEDPAVLDRGVHTAPFYVLIGANMPAVLAEIAFVSNPEDEKQLKTPEFRELVARSLLRGVKSYLESLNRTQLRQLTEAQHRSTLAGGRGAR